MEKASETMTSHFWQHCCSSDVVPISMGVEGEEWLLGPIVIITKKHPLDESVNALLGRYITPLSFVYRMEEPNNLLIMNWFLIETVENIIIDMGGDDISSKYKLVYSRK